MAGQASAVKSYCGDHDDDDDDARLVAGQASAVKLYCGDDEDATMLVPGLGAVLVPMMVAVRLVAGLGWWLGRPPP